MKRITKVPLRERLHGAEASLLKRYQRKVVGDERLGALLKHEIITVLVGNLPGAIGYLLRKWFYPYVFRSVGKGVIFGRGLTLRHARRIAIGDRVAIDDWTMLDASGSGDEGMVLGDDVIISRNCILHAKTGPLTIGDRTTIGPNVIVCAVPGVVIGQSVGICANCYIGGGQYGSNRLDIPMLEQGDYSRGPIVIENDVVLYPGATVLDGVRVGTGCIVRAGAMVTEDLPDYAITVGVAANAVGTRQKGQGANPPILFRTMSGQSR
jgi:acetyltransferase-like isoleucine patch superfamily enzyme